MQGYGRGQKLTKVRKLILFVLLFISLAASSQGRKEKLADAVRTFHRLLVSGNSDSIHQYTDRAMTYGHSNGWIETKTELIKNLETGYLDYHSYREDSLTVTVDRNLGHARFIADIDVTLNGKPGVYHLKVLEVWKKKGKRWILFARQALK
jgi:hypothetical protein